MKKINKNSLIIFGYSEILTLGLVVNSKLNKVKEFNILKDNDEDKFFKVISSFISNDACFNKVFYSSGPGGFTIIRRIISYVKALKFNNCAKTKFFGLNHLFIIAHYFNHNFKSNDNGYILSILNHSKDNFFQIYQKRKKSYIFLDCLSEIKNVDSNDIQGYLENLKLTFQNINFIYLGSNSNCLSFLNNVKLVERSNVLEIIVKISDLIENNLIRQTDYKHFFQENFNPLYGKLPSTN